MPSRVDIRVIAWPGNIRELEHTIEQAVTFAQQAVLVPEDLPMEVREGVSPDDDQIFCQFLATALTRQEIDVTWTTDGLASLTLARRRPYDVFILDVRMPQILGTDLAATLKQDHPSTQIILISAFADAALEMMHVDGPNRPTLRYGVFS